MFDLCDTIRTVASRMASWEAAPVDDDIANTTWAEMDTLTQAAVDTPARDLPELKAKARALVAANLGAVREDDDPEQTAPEALIWSLVRDIEAMT